MKSPQKALFAALIAFAVPALLGYADTPVALSSAAQAQSPSNAPQNSSQLPPSVPQSTPVPQASPSPVSSTVFDLSKDQGSIPPPPAESPSASGRLGSPIFASSSAAAANTPSYLPKPPLVSAEAGNRAVQLGWYPNEGPFPISAYLVYRGTDPAYLGRRHINRQSISSPEYLDDDDDSFVGPKNKITYYYGVRAIDEDGRISPMSDIVSATPNGPLLPPGRFRALADDGKVALEWLEPLSTGPFDLSAYQLFRSETSGQYGAPYQIFAPDIKVFVDQVPNGKVFFYSIRSIDTAGNSSDASAELKAYAYRPLKAPKHLEIRGLGDADVMLKWDASEGQGTYQVAAYNVFRSTMLPVDTSARPLNRLPVIGDSSFEDDADHSMEAPKLGTLYHYEVVAMDDHGGSSPPCAPVDGSPTASLTGFSLQNAEIPGMSGSTLSIQGKKSITVGYNNVSAIGGGIPPVASGLQINQNLKVNLTGNVGSKIKVDVDYDDSNQNTSDQNISVVYTGDTTEVFKEFAFGDVNMDLGNGRTEWGTYNKSLFGAKVKIASPDNSFRLTAVGAQTKGFTETKKIVGGLESAMTGNTLGREILDSSFIPFRYYYISRDPHLINKTLPVSQQENIVPGSVQIYYDTPNQNALNNSSLLAKQGAGGIQYNFRLLVPGQDYLIDLSTGIITFTSLNIGATDSLAVAYKVETSGGQAVSQVGYDNNGNFDFSPADLNSDYLGGTTSPYPGLHMIQAGRINTSTYDSHMSFQYYSLGNQNILNPQLDPAFRMYVYGTNQQPVYQLSTQGDFSNVVQFDVRQGIMKFTAPFPFQASLAQTQNLAIDSGYSLFSAAFPGGNSDIYRYSQPMHNFSTHIEFKYQLANYTLRPGIIKGSEIITLNGRRLLRDSDYFLDYQSGFLSFSNPDLITSDSTIVATYEYTPFGGNFASTIWGLRGEYDLSKDLSIGSTFIDNSSSAPLDTPDLGSTPYDLNILDGDIQYNITRDTVKKLLSSLDNDADVPFDVKLKAELAHSTYNPNTYSRNNENGVAMLDDFESMNNVVSLSMQKEGIWEPSSRPTINNTATTTYPRGERRFDTIQNNIYQTEEYAANPNESPTRSMLEIDYHNFSDPSSWDSIVQGLPSNENNLATYTQVQIIVRANNPVNLYMDVGQVNEDSNDNGQLDYETTGVFSAASDVGTWTNQNQGGTCSGSDCYPFPPILGWSAPPANPFQTYSDPNYWGAYNNVVDTEDVNHDGVLETTENFYRIPIQITASMAQDAWQVITLNLTDPSVEIFPANGGRSKTPGNANYFTNIQAVRLWWNQPGAPTLNAGHIIIESIQFQGAKWQTLTDPNSATAFQTTVFPDTSKIQAVPINEEDDGTDPGVTLGYNYTPDLNFFTIQVQADSLRETAMQLEYSETYLDMTNGVPNFFVQRIVGNNGSLDMGNYQNMRVDIFKPQFQSASGSGTILPGEILLIRLGADDLNYFEYHVYLDSIAADGNWHTIPLALNGSDGLRTVVGTPYLRSVQVITFAIATQGHAPNPNAPIVGSNNVEFIRIDNLRLTDAETLQGNAFKIGATYDLNGLQVVENYRDVDSNFVQMDQQNIPPGRHQTTHSVTTTFEPVKNLPVNASYQTDYLYTESANVNDPLYSQDFVNPDHEDQIVKGGVDFKMIPQLDMNTQAAWEIDRDKYLETYIDNERSLLNDPSLNPDSSSNHVSVQQSYSYVMPKSVPVLNSDQFAFSWNWAKNEQDFDSPSLPGQNFTNINFETAGFSGHYAGLYHPLSFLSVAPGYALSENFARGTIQAPVVQVPYYTLDSNLDFDAYAPQSMEFDPSLVISLDKTKFIHAPKLAYNFKQSWDFILYQVTTPGTLDASGTLSLDDFFGAEAKLPDIQVTEEWGVNSVINSLPRVRDQNDTDQLEAYMAGDPSLHNRYGQTTDADGNTVDDPSTVPNEVWMDRALSTGNILDSVWWVRLGGNPNDPFGPDDIAVSDSNRQSTNLSTSWDVQPLPGWKGTLRPHFQYQNQATMSQPEQITNQMQWGGGADLDINNPPIPFADWYNPGLLQVIYEYQTANQNDVGGNLTDYNYSHDFTVSLPRKATEAFAVDLRYHERISEDQNFTNSAGSGAIVTDKFAADPQITANYVFHINSTWKMWNIWPFDGRELKIKQNFELYNTLSYDYFSQTQPTIPGAGDLGSTKYDINDRLKYDLLENVEMNLTLDNQWDYSFGTVPSNYYEIGISAGLSATF